MSGKPIGKAVALANGWQRLRRLRPAPSARGQAEAQCAARNREEPAMKINPKRQCEIGLLLIACLVLFGFAFSARAAAQTATTIDICDRTPAVEAAILAAIPAPKPSCAAVPAASLSAIESLDLPRKGLTALLAGDFDNLDGLKTLSLSLASLPAGIRQLGGAGKAA